MHKLKSDIVKYSQKMYDERLVAATSGNISACDRQTGKIAITPTSANYHLLKPEDIVVLDFDGNVLEGDRRPSSEWKMHVHIYKNMPEATSIVHTHSTYATAFAVVRKPIDLILIEMEAYLGGAIPLAEFAEPGSIELGEACVKALEANKSTCLLSNHGALAVGRTIEDAYIRATYLEDAAKTYYLAKTLGEPYILDENR